MIAGGVGSGFIPGWAKQIHGPFSVALFASLIVCSLPAFAQSVSAKLSGGLNALSG
jgi:hypothetical protein